MPATPGSLRANIPKMFAFKFLVGMHFFAGVLIPFFTEWGHITFGQVMLLQSWFVAWGFVLEVPTGAVADRFGRKTSMLCGAATLSLAALVYASKADFRVFLAAEFLWALAQAFVSGADQALGYDTLKALGEEARSKDLFAKAAGFEIGAIMVSAPVGSLIAARWGLRTPMLCMACAYAAAVLLASTLVEPPRRTPVTKRLGGVMLEGMAYFRGHRILRALAFDSVTVWTMSFMMIWLFQPVIKSLGIPLAAYGFVTAAFTGLQILVMNNFDVLEDWSGGRKRYLLASALIPAACYLLVSFARTPWLAVPAIVALVTFGMSRSVLLDNYMNKHIESERRATVLSTVAMGRQLLCAVTYPTVGWLAARSLHGTLLALGTAGIVCALASRVKEEYLIS